MSLPESVGVYRRSAPRTWAIAALGAVALAAVAVLYRFPAIAQDPSYHLFADTRTVLGVPNGLNVLSNGAFAIVAVAGLWLLWSERAILRDRRERWPWLVLLAAVALTSLGSAWYHLSPSNETLLWDRLPMAIGFMGLLAAVIAERISPAAGLRVLGPALLLGLGGVLYWHFTERAGAGDLRPYVLVQFFPLMVIPFMLALFAPAYTTGYGFVIALGLYAVAKLTEVGDERIFRLLRVVSGHTLKHLVAAAAIAALVWMLARRRPIV